MSDNSLSRQSTPSNPQAPKPTTYEAVVNVWGLARAFGRRASHDVEECAKAWDAVLANVLYTPPRTPTKGEQNLVNFAEQYTADAETNQTRRARSQGGTD